jgi:hypothetical protein
LTRRRHGKADNFNAVGVDIRGLVSLRARPRGAEYMLEDFSLFVLTIVVGLAAGAMSVHWFGL